jgi:hypothetical protein
MIDPHLAPPPEERLPARGMRTAIAVAVVLAWGALIGLAWVRDGQERTEHAKALAGRPGEAPGAMPPPAMGGGAVGGGPRQSPPGPPPGPDPSPAAPPPAGSPPR